MTSEAFLHQQLKPYTRKPFLLDPLMLQRDHRSVDSIFGFSPLQLSWTFLTFLTLKDNFMPISLIDSFPAAISMELHKARRGPDRAFQD